MKKSTFIFLILFLACASISRFLCPDLFNTQSKELPKSYYAPIKYSPMGKYILLKNHHNNDFNLAIYDTQKNTKTHIHKSNRSQTSLHFSPNSEKLLFQIRDQLNIFDIFVLNLSDMSTRKLNAPSSLSGIPPIHWSPNSNEIGYYEVGKKETFLYLNNISNEDSSKLIASGLTKDSVFTWSPDGDMILLFSGIEGSDLLRLNKNGEIVTRYALDKKDKVKEILWANPNTAFLVKLPDQAEFSQMFSLNLINGTTKSLVAEIGNIEKLLWLEEKNSILYHSSYRGVTDAKTYEIHSGLREQITKLEDGSLEIQTAGDNDNSLFGIQYSYLEQPKPVKISNNKESEVLFRVLSSDEPRIPRSQIITLDSPEGSIRAFLWEPNSPKVSKKAVISIHGGPATFIDPEWDREYANLISNGWSILAPNYHGSSNEGESFIKKKRLSIQIADIISAIKFMRRRLPNNSKLFILGESYGSRIAMEAIRRVGEQIDGLILTSAIIGSHDKIPCEKLPPYVSSFHGDEDNLNSPEKISTYLNKMLGENNFSFQTLAEEGHILRRESSLSLIRNAILRDKTPNHPMCP